MKKTILIVILTCFLLPFMAEAQTKSFSVSLGYGSKNRTEILKLQGFLVGQGLLSTIPTGNYLRQTQEAVKQFQLKNNIEATGFFGPLTRTAANSKLATNLAPKATIGTYEVLPDDSQAAAPPLASAKKVVWNTSNYPTSATVNINLLKKTLTSPATYELSRQIAKDTINDGTESWIPLSKEKNAVLYVEVTCSTTYLYKDGCQSNQAPVLIK